MTSLQQALIAVLLAGNSRQPQIMSATKAPGTEASGTNYGLKQSGGKRIKEKIYFLRVSLQGQALMLSRQWVLLAFLILESTPQPPSQPIRPSTG